MRRLAAAAVALALAGSAGATGGARAVLAWPPTRYASAELAIWRDVAGVDPLSVRVTARGLDVTVAVPASGAVRVPLPAGARCAPGVDACAITCDRAAGSASFSVLLQSPDTAGVADTLLLTAHDTVRVPPAASCGRAPRVMSMPASDGAELAQSASVASVVPVAGPTRVMAPATACTIAVDVTLLPGEALTLACEGEGADLTGLAFSADAPVLAISGNAVAAVPLSPGLGYSGDVVLDVAPDAAWLGATSTYLVPPLPRAAAHAGRGDVVRLLALADVTVRVRDDQGGDTTIDLAALDHRDLDTAGAGVDRTLLIEADGPLAAWHVPKSRAMRGRGDPAGLPLVPRERFVLGDRVFVPDGYGEGATLVVVTEAGAAARVDGAPISGFVTFAGSNLAAATIALPPPAVTTGTVHALDGDAPLGAWLLVQGGFKASGHAAAEAWPAPGTAILRGLAPEPLLHCATVSGTTFEDAAPEPAVFWSIEDPAASLRVRRCAAGACLSW